MIVPLKRSLIGAVVSAHPYAWTNVSVPSPKQRCGRWRLTCRDMSRYVVRKGRPPPRRCWPMLVRRDNSAFPLFGTVVHGASNSSGALGSVSDPVSGETRTFFDLFEMGSHKKKSAQW